MKKLVLLVSLLWSSQALAQPDTENHSPRYWFRQYEAAQKRNESLKFQVEYLKNAVEEAQRRNEVPDRDHFFHYTRVHFELGQTQFAYDGLKQLIVRNQHDHEAHDLFGLVCWRLGQLEEALIHFNAAIEEKGKNAVYRIHRGNLKNRLAVQNHEPRKYDEAIVDFNEASRRGHDTILYQVHLGRGESYLGKSVWENAATDFRASLKLSNNTTFRAKAFTGVAQILYQLKQYNAAIDTFSKAITIDNQLHEALDGRGLAYLATDKVSEALADFSNAIEVIDLKNYRYDRSLVYTKQKNYRAALADLNVAITAIQGKTGDSTAQPFFQRGYVEYYLKNYRNAQTDLTTAVKLQSDLADAYSYRGWAKIQIAKVTQLSEGFLQSMTDFNRAIQLQPNSAFAYCGRGLAQYYSATSLDKAKEDFDTAIRQDPKLAEAYLGRGKLRSNETPENAISDFDQVIFLDRGENQRQAYALRGQLQFKLKHFQEAEADFNDLVRNFPDSLIYTQQRGMTRFHLNHYIASLEDLQLYLRTFPNDVMALLYVAKNQLELNNYAKSIEIAQNAQRMEPSNQAIVAFLSNAQQAYLEYRKRTEKATIQWYAPNRLNNNELRITHYVDTLPNAHYIVLHGNVKSISQIQRIQLIINDKPFKLEEKSLKDGSTDFKAKVRFDSTMQHLNVELKTQNQAGDSTLIKEIELIRRFNPCLKPKKGLALVIGNRNYNNPNLMTLKNTVNDAHDIADSLKTLGFQIDTLYDGSFGKLRDAIEKFIDALENYEIGFFYYGGHGGANQQSNYLIPTDMQGADYARKAYGLATIFDRLNHLEQKSCQLVMILDACRDSVMNGFNPIPTNPIPSNTMIHFAANAGQQAQDGSVNNDRNGLYTYHLLQYLTKRIRLDDIFGKVHDDVSRDNKEQTPIMVNNLGNSVLFLKR
jgi:tetratricopeptide (TPR) repeat protein